MVKRAHRFPGKEKDLFSKESSTGRKQASLQPSKRGEREKGNS